MSLFNRFYILMIALIPILPDVADSTKITFVDVQVESTLLFNLQTSDYQLSSSFSTSLRELSVFLLQKHFSQHS